MTDRLGVDMSDVSTCSFPACGRPIEAKGRCQTHNRQARRGQELTPIRDYQRGADPLARFMQKVTVEAATGCWRWENTGPQEYGRFADSGKRDYAHRWIWEYTHGPIPPGMDIDHFNHCYCVNPEHLRLCTHAQNGQNLKPDRQNGIGLRGVSYHKASGRWHARVKLRGRAHSFGYHATPEAAADAARAGRAKLYTHARA
jgi:hypothetical protein